MKKTAKKNIKIHKATIVSASDVDVITLKDLFEVNCATKIIDFMTIDSEGLELKILSGNDWNKFRPIVIVVELTPDSDGALIKSMAGYGYSIVYYNGTNGIFVDNQYEIT